MNFIYTLIYNILIELFFSIQSDKLDLLRGTTFFFA